MRRPFIAIGAGLVLLGWGLPGPAVADQSLQISVTSQGFEPAELQGVPGERLKIEVTNLTAAAMSDERFAAASPIGARSRVAVSVSLLHNELDMGGFSRGEVQHRYCHGVQALAVEQGRREGHCQGLLLPMVASWFAHDAAAFVGELLGKAGIKRGPCNWRRFDCATWIADGAGARELRGGFPQHRATASLDGLAKLYLGYLARNQEANGRMRFGYFPFHDSHYAGIDAARQSHAAWTLARAGKRAAAQNALDFAARQRNAAALSASRDAFTLLAWCELGRPQADVASLSERLWRSVDRHGRIRTGASPLYDPEDVQNYAPGQVLLALAKSTEYLRSSPDAPALDRAFRYYRHRFRHRRDFGQVSWMALAWAAWWKIAPKREWAEMVYEISDWILEFQNRRAGGFVTDHQPDAPGFTTAVYLEAIAAARATAVADRNTARATRYERSFLLGFEFLDGLTIQNRDAAILPNIRYAIGGLRENPYSSHMRIDFAQHALAAILEFNSIAVDTSD